MTARTTPQPIEPGTVVEFFEAKDILLGVCLAVKNQRLSILSENNRELNLARSRVLHASSKPLDLKEGREGAVQALKLLKRRREDLAAQVNVEEIWEVLEEEAEGVELQDLVGLVFPEEPADDEAAAVQRVLLRDRLYFQFKDGRFYARSREKVEQRRLELEREAEQERLLEAGAFWLGSLKHKKAAFPAEEFRVRILDALKDYALFAQESAQQAFAKELLKRAGLTPQPHSAFRTLVRLGEWREDENLYLYQQGIARDFPQEILDFAVRKAETLTIPDGRPRRDLRGLHAFTIDSAQTKDYDDALSFRILEEGLYEVGIHIADAAAVVDKDDPVDREARSRATSIYLPDARIPMLPPVLSEGVCSLQAGRDRLALTFLVRIDREGTVLSREVFSSIIRVREQLTYEDVNRKVEEEEAFRELHRLSQRLRAKRLEMGAVILPLPEINVYVNAEGMIQVSRYEKETPSQIIVSEWMIAANSLAAEYLAERGVPAIYRSQGECRPETDQVQSEHEIFHIYRQRRLFARAELETEPGVHCSLGVPTYTSITSPIRRYIDLVVQRQLVHALETGEAFYSEEELRDLITRLRAQLSRVVFVHRKWTRYWILKYLEQEDIQTMNAIVLDKNARFAQILIPDFLLETQVPLPPETTIQQGEMIAVKVERLNPRDEVLRVQVA